MIAKLVLFFERQPGQTGTGKTEDFSPWCLGGLDTRSGTYPNKQRDA